MYFFVRRLRQKLLVLVPILLAAGLLFGLMLLGFWLISPYLPSAWREGLLAVDFKNPAAVKLAFDTFYDDLSQTWGLGIPFFFLGLQALQVIFAPIPGQVMGLLGGYLFGFLPGLALSLLGLALGSGLVLLLGRYLGQRLLHHFVPKTIYARFEYLVDQAGYATFFMIFLLPGLPDDAVCFIAGLSHLRLLPLWGLCLLGRLPGMALLTWTGTRLEEPTPDLSYWLWGLGMLSLIIWFFQNEIEAFFHKPKTEANQDKS